MLRIKKHARQDVVYGYTEHCHFGDTWAFLSYLLRLSEETGRPSRYFASHLVVDRIFNIRPFLRSNGRVRFVPEAAQRVFHYCEPYWVKFVPTIRKWHRPCATKSNIIAYQFDGNHLADQKNLPPERLHYFLTSLRKIGYNPIDVGHQRPISTIVNVLSNCRFFVGCPSGLSVAAMSVGCPISLITRQLDAGMKSFLRDCQYKKSPIPVKMFTSVDQCLYHTRRQHYLCKFL